jgi:hypothetical protein
MILFFDALVEVCMANDLQCERYAGFSGLAPSNERASHGARRRPDFGSLATQNSIIILQQRICDPP